MKTFQHINARSIKEAAALLGEYQGKARVMAGGTDLLGVLKDGILPDYPEAVVNLKKIRGLEYIKKGPAGLKIGALTRLAEVAKSALLQEKYPVIAQAAEAVASPQIRNMATVGGNLCQDTRCWYYRYPHALGGSILCYRKGKGPCLAVRGDNRYHAVMGGKKCFAVCPSDMAVALSALEAKVGIAGSKGQRKVPIADFYTVLGNILGQDEIVTAIEVPRIAKGARQAFLKFTLRKPIDFALVSVASVIAVEEGICLDARIALGGVAPTPLRAEIAETALKGKPLNEKAAEAAAEAAVVYAKPLSMNGYKIDITRALVKRAILSEGIREVR